MRSVHITRTLVISVIIVVICASYFIWYHFDMYSDVDKDGIIKKLEIKYGTDPHKPNFVLRYLITLDRVAYYDKLKSLDRGEFNDIKKEFINYYINLPDYLKNNENIDKLVCEIIKDGEINEKEVEIIRDPCIIFCLSNNLNINEALNFKEVNFNDEFKEFVYLMKKLNFNERNSEKVKNFLNKVLSDKNIDSKEVLIFDDKFINKTIPQIYINWNASKVINDKIYDIEVYIKAKDDKTNIKSAIVKFVPVEYYYMIEKYGMKPEDYQKIFPQDEIREFKLSPIDGKFDELNEEFKIEIKEIMGGREYKIIAIIEDEAGNICTKEIKTPYIRQYENVAKKDDIIIMASYMTWYVQENWGWPKDYEFDGRPILGAYHQRDKIIIYKHMDWATGYGIDVFLVDWSHTIYEDDPFKTDQNIMEIFKVAKNFSGPPKIGILLDPVFENMKAIKCGDWTCYDIDDPKSVSYLLNITRYIAERYMKDENYFKYNEKPVIYIYESSSMRGNMSELLKKLRYIIKNETNMEPIFIGDEISWLFTYPEDWLNINGNTIERLRAFNVISDWAGSYDGSNKEYVDNYEIYMDILYNKWSKFLINENLHIVPSVLPGFKFIYVYATQEVVPLPKSPDKFKERLEIALNYMDLNIRMIRIDTWNDWGEWTNIEPDTKYYFKLLEVLKETLENYTK